VKQEKYANFLQKYFLGNVFPIRLDSDDSRSIADDLVSQGALKKYQTNSYGFPSPLIQTVVFHSIVFSKEKKYPSSLPIVGENLDFHQLNPVNIF